MFLRVWHNIHIVVRIDDLLPLHLMSQRSSLLASCCFQVHTSELGFLRGQNLEFRLILLTKQGFTTIRSPLMATSMYQLRLHRTPADMSVISCSLHQHDSCIYVRKGSSSASRLSSRVSRKTLTEGLSRARCSGSGLSPRIGEFLGGGHGREERVRVSNMRRRAYREEDWAKLFEPEAMKMEELKEYLNDDPIWLWVFKSWHSGIKGALQFLWTQPGQIKYIEWPSVKSTVKMALLTLVVVMFLMVFLYSVDSLFRHLLKSSMRPMA